MGWFAFFGFLAIIVGGALLYPMVCDWIAGRSSPARGRSGSGARVPLREARPASRTHLSAWELIGRGMRDGPARWDDRTIERVGRRSR